MLGHIHNILGAGSDADIAITMNAAAGGGSVGEQADTDPGDGEGVVCPGCGGQAQSWTVPAVCSSAGAQAQQGKAGAARGGRLAAFRTDAEPIEAQSLPVRLDPRPVIKEHRRVALLGLLILVVGEAVSSYLSFGVGASSGASASGLGGTLHVVWIMSVPAVIAALVAYPFFRSAYWRRRIARGFARSYPVWESARYCARCDAVWIPPTASVAADAIATLPGLPAQRMLSTTEFRLVLRHVGGFEQVS